MSAVYEETRPVAVDVIIQTAEGVVLVRRKWPPYQDRWALPGGFVAPNETCEQAAIREAFEETGLQIKLDRLVNVYSRPGRDPRHTVAVCFLAHVMAGTMRPDSDATEVRAFRSMASEHLAFDHGEMCADAGVLVEGRESFTDHD